METIRRIKWRNILGLLFMVLLVIALLQFVSFLSTLLYGDCVERGDERVCFSVKRMSIGANEATAISLEITNTGKSSKEFEISMGLSPNLRNLTSLVQRTGALAPGDTIKREFRIAAKGEKGRFVVRFNIDRDTKWDKEMYINVA